MDTPIYDFVKKYREASTLRLHMPGHKGNPLLGCEPMDITEIKGADELYHATGIIRQSEDNASALFGSQRTLYATGGSSQCIGAMVYLAMLQGGGKKCILAARNAHKAFLHACALLDLEVEWLYPTEDSSLCSCPVSPKQLEGVLQTMEELPFAVYLTSPDYLGGMADIQGISAVCKKFSTPLLVDNAHGAYLRFLPQSLHPLDLGADLCCDSAHKTLPVLTGGAYLHVSKQADSAFAHAGKQALSLFGSTSPSYLTLQSLDLCNRILSDNYQPRLTTCIQHINHLAFQLQKLGYALQHTDPLKLVLNGADIGMTGFALGEFLREWSIEPEFADEDSLVLMFTPENKEGDFLKILHALPPVVPRNGRENKSVLPTPGQQCISIREAMFSKRETLPVEHALGRICAAPAVSCPPAIPIAISGERITAEMISLFLLYGIGEIEVVMETSSQNRTLF